MNNTHTMKDKISTLIHNRRHYKKPGTTPGRFSRYSTKQLFRLTLTLAWATLQSFWRNHYLASRLTALFMALVILFSILYPIYDSAKQQKTYNVENYEKLLDAPIKQYADKLSFDAKTQKYAYNQGYMSGGDVGGDSIAPKITATFASPVDKNAVTVTDPVNNVAVSMIPKFPQAAPKNDQNRIIYPIIGKDALSVYTLKSTGLKEDIILDSAPGKDTLQLDYDLVLPDGTEARQEGDGSVAIYGVNSELLGNVTTGTEKDAELLKKARENGEKSTLLFKIPTPFVVESNKKQSSARAWFSLNRNKLTLFANGLKSASYPLSIDPSIYVETAAKFMRGNNETNIDFDTTNELIQKSQTTGARIDGWADSTDMTAGLWDHSIATAGGYIYRAGGRVDPTMPYIVGQQSSIQATNNTDFVMNMPTVRPAGDLYVALIAHDGTGVITPPAGGGWTEYADNDAGGGNTREHAAYYKIGTDEGGGNEAASYTFTGASEQWTGVIIRIKGFNSSSPISGTAGRGSSASDVVPVFPSTTPAHDATLIIRSAAIDADTPSDYTWLPNGDTKVFAGESSADAANSVGLVVTTLDRPPLATNATGTTTLVSDGLLVDSYGASSIAIRPATVTAGYQNSLEWAQFNNSTLAIDSPNPGAGVCSDWCNNAVYNLPANRVGMSMVAYNGYLYALGGTPDGTAANSANTVWIAKIGANGEPSLWHPTDTNKNNWAYWYSSSNTLPTALSYASIAAYNNRLYLIGGKNTSGNSINDVHIASFSPTGDIGPWTTTGAQNLSTPLARFGHSVHVYNDYMYIIGGNNNGTLLNTTYYSKLNADGTMNPWVQTTSFTTGRASFGGQMTAVWGAYVYLAGGCTALTGNYCNTIASDVQLASINADGTLAPWNPVLTLSNQRIGYSFAAWQGGLYRLGGCNRQNTSTGACYATHRNVEYGAVNPAGDASTVSNSEPSGTAPCSGGSPYNCDLPPAGDGAGQGGQMSSMVVVNNGYIYNIGGCVDGSSTCDSDMSGNVSYAALNSQGQMVAPAVCATPNTSYGLWCVDNTNRINGTAGLGAAGVAVFNNMIYVGGGTNSTSWQSNMWRVLLNADGSLNGVWQSQTFASIGAGSARGYMYMFTRANPGSASANPGNLYLLGGCSGTAGIGCSTYYTDTIKCNIEVAGTIAGCSTANQMQVDADNIAAGNQGLGLMAGTVYANRLYLVGGSCAATGAAGNPCGSTYAANRKDTIYAAINASNNIVDVDDGSSSGSWNFATAQMNPVRRRAVSFGYNGYIYSLAGYSGTASLQDLLFAKINVSTGDLGAFDSSGVVVTPRWDLRAIVSNGYVYAIGGCGAGAAPANCTSMQPEVQTFQLYNNDSGTPVSYTASANQFTTDRLGASSTIMDGYLYVAGGCTSTTDCTTATNSVQYSKIDEYGNLGAWSAGGNLPDVRVWGQLENVNGTLYYIGGQTSTATDEQSTVYYTTSVASGNPTWSGTAATNSLPAARTKHSAVVWDNRIYVTGGLDGSASPTTTVYVSPKLTGGNITSAWTTSTAFDIARSGHTAIAYANNLYILGGFDNANYLNDVQFASIGYKAGTISQSGTGTITGTGTTWTAAMVGSTLQYRDGEIATITGFTDATHIDVSVSKTVTAGSGYTILDGSVGAWTDTTSLPEPITQADGFAANGYMYLVGGRSAPGDCASNTLQAPISANTTIASGNNATGIGEWYETNVKYSGERYGNSVSYGNGKLYALGGACDSAPAPIATMSQAFSTAAGAHNVTMPAVVDTGDLLVVLFTNDGNATVTTPAGWTAPTNNTALGNTNQVRGSVFVKDAAGTEDGTTVNFQTSASEEAAAQVYRIPAAKWEGNIASVEVANNGIAGTTNAPDSPNLDPAGWGTENTLWIAYAAGSSYTAPNATSGYPDSYINGWHTISNTGNNGASTTSAQRIFNAASENPPAFAMSTTSAGAAFTIAVRPAAGFTYTGANRAVQTTLYSQPQVAKYSRLIDTDSNVFPTKWLLNGLDNSIGARWRVDYRSATDSSYVQSQASFDGGTNGNTVNASNEGYDSCYGLGTGSYTYSNSQYVTPGLSMRNATTVGAGSTSVCQDDYTNTQTRYERFYIRFDSSVPTNFNILSFWDGSTSISELRLTSSRTLALRDNFIAEATSAALAADTWHRIEVAMVNDQMTLRTFEGANLHGSIPSQTFTITLDGTPNNQFDSTMIGITSGINSTWGLYIDDHKVSSSNWVGSAYPVWGQNTIFGDVTLGQPETYVPLDDAGNDTEYARWYFFTLSIDASQTFGYPEDVNRGPTISDLSLFFTSDPSKRMRHGKTFTGGEQQPLDTPF